MRFFRKCLAFLDDSDHLVCFNNLLCGFQSSYVEVTAFLISILLNRQYEQLHMNNLQG